MASFVRRLARVAAGVTLAAMLAAGCASGNIATSAGTANAKATSSDEIMLYTSVSQPTIDAVISAFNAKHPDIKVSVFRAPTGSLNARIATDERIGGLKADVLWVSDPLTMHGYDSQGLLKRYTAPAAKALPAQYRTPSFAGAGLLYLVLVYQKGLSPAPTSWNDLTSAAYQGAAAVPDPGFAGSAMGALGYFGEQQGFGLDFYKKLKSNGGVQVKSPEDVITAVAQGKYKLGMTIADGALAAVKKGSPVKVAWPAPGAIAIYSPIGVTSKSKHVSAAESFEDFVLSKPGQQAIAKTGRQPSLPGVPGIDRPDGAKVVSPDWPAFFGDKAALLAGYQKIFGG